MVQILYLQVELSLQEHICLVVTWCFTPRPSRGGSSRERAEYCFESTASEEKSVSSAPTSVGEFALVHKLGAERNSLSYLPGTQ